MSFSEVKNLRKEGKLSDALEIAVKDLENNPEDIWNQRSIAWVYYDLLKIAQQQNNFNDFVSIIKNIKQLELPATETMIFDSCAWSIGKLLFTKNEIIPPVLDNLFDIIKEFEFSKPKDSYSFLLKAFKKHATNWDDFVRFVEWWGLENFQQNDYQNFVLENGNKIPSLVESIYIAISRKLLQENNKAKIKEYIPKIAHISAKYSNMQYPPYYYAKMLLELGDKSQFMKAFLPFAKKKSRDFWVWNLMSENFDKESKEYFSCLCKSATCGAPDKFTGDVREKLANVFIAKKQYAEAKSELQKIMNSRLKEGWSLRDKHLRWQNYIWWKTTNATKNNFNIYNTNLAVAENLLFSDIPEDIIVIERVNKEKSVVNFVASEQKYGFFNYSRLKAQPKVGDIYAVRFEERKDKTSNFFRVKTIIKTDKIPSKEVLKNVDGNLRIDKGNSFGFVKGVFVSPHIISKYNLQNGSIIKSIALKTYNSKRKVWGWSIINIIKE